MPLYDWDKTPKTYAVNKDDSQRNPLGMVNQQTTSYASDMNTGTLPKKTQTTTQPKTNYTVNTVTRDPYADYRGTLDDLYNKVMGYGSYSAGRYSQKYDTSALEGQLTGWLNEIDNYGDFEYDLNADLLYKQMADNYVQQGQLAMQDAMANAAALTGGYGNSYAASVGNQAYQQHLTALNNSIPALQQQALNVWQAGLDQLYGQLDAGSQQLNNLLALEAQNFAQWQANEQNANNEWLAGYNQINDQYNLGLNHANTMVSWQPQTTTYSGGSSKKETSKTPTQVSGLINAVGATTTPTVAGTLLSNPTNLLTPELYEIYAQAMKR